MIITFLDHNSREEIMVVASAGIPTLPLQRAHASSISERVKQSKKKVPSYKISPHPKWKDSVYVDSNGKRRMVSLIFWNGGVSTKQ